MALPVSFNANLSVAPQNSYHGPFKSSAGNFYAVLRGDTALAGRLGHLSLLKATDPTDSFAQQDTQKPGGSTNEAFTSIWTFQKGDIVDIVCQKIETAIDAKRAYYLSADLGPDTFSTGVIIETLGTDDDGPSAEACSVAREETGTDVVVAYQGDPDMVAGTEYARIDANRSTDDGATWGGPISIDNATAVHWTGPVIVRGSSDRMHIFFKDDTNNDGFQRTLRSDDSLETFPAAFDDTIHVDDVYLFGHGGDGSTVYCPYKDLNARTSVVSFTSADTPTPSITTGVSNQSLKSISGGTVHALTLDGTDRHYLYSFVTTADLFRDVDTGAGWGTDIEVLSGVTVNHVSPNVYDRSGTKLAYVYDDGGTIKYNEVDLGGGADLDFEPTAASLIITQQQPTLVIGGTQAKDFQPDAASLVIADQQPTLTQTFDFLFEPAAASVVLTSEQPTLTITEDILFEPAAASLIIAAEQPTLDITAGGVDHDFQPDAASLVITQAQPSLSVTADLTLQPDAASLVVTTEQPALAQTFDIHLQPGPASTVITAEQPTLTQGFDVYLQPDAASLVVTQAQPSLSVTAAGGDWAQVGNGLTITGASNPALAALSATRVAYVDSVLESLRTYDFDGTDWAQVGNGLTITGAGVPALADLSATRVAYFDNLLDSLRTYDFTEAGGDISLQPAAASLVITQQQPTLVIGGTQAKDFQPDAASLVIADQQPTLTVGIGTQFQPDAAALVIAAEQPTLTQTFDFLFEPDAGSLVIATEQPTLSQTFDIQFQPDAASLVLTQQQPTLDQTFDIFKQPDAASVAITTEQPTLTQTRDIFLRPTAASIRITTSQPTMEIVAQADLEFQPTAASLVIGTVQPEFQISVPPPPPPDDLTTTAQIPAPGSSQMILIPPTEQHRAQVEMTASAVIGGLRQFTRGKKKR